MSGNNLLSFGDVSLTTLSNITFPLLIALFTIRWLWSVIRVIRDSHSRSDSRGFHVLSIVIIVFTTPIIGLPLYRLIRPWHYKTPQEDRQKALLSGTKKCKKCSFFNPRDCVFCQDCGEKLDGPCRECKKEYPLCQDYCGYCGAPNITSLR